MNMDSLESDHSLFLKVKNGSLIEITRNYVDDFITASDEMNQCKYKLALNMFDSNSRRTDLFTLFGAQLTTTLCGELSPQSNYFKLLVTLSPEAS